MKILSFDQATQISGFSVFDNCEYIESGVIKKDKKIPIEQRTQDMAKSICLKIKEVEPQLVAIEDIQNQNSIATVIQLARLQGMIMFYCANKGIRCEILKPTVWREALRYAQGPKVKREQLKAQSMDYVKEHFGLNDIPEDQAEAICINAATNKLFN